MADTAGAWSLKADQISPTSDKSESMGCKVLAGRSLSSETLNEALASDDARLSPENPHRPNDKMTLCKHHGQDAAPSAPVPFCFAAHPSGALHDSSSSPAAQSSPSSARSRRLAQLQGSGAAKSPASRALASSVPSPGRAPLMSAGAGAAADSSVSICCGTAGEARVPSNPPATSYAARGILSTAPAAAPTSSASQGTSASSPSLKAAVSLKHFDQHLRASTADSISALPFTQHLSVLSNTSSPISSLSAAVPSGFALKLLAMQRLVRKLAGNIMQRFVANQQQLQQEDPALYSEAPRYGTTGLTMLLTPAAASASASVAATAGDSASSVTHSFLCQDGSTPLHLAAMFGSLEALQEVLAQQHAAVGSMTSSADSCGRLPLHLAAIRGDSAVVTLLCSAASASSDIAAADLDGMTALHHACMWGHVQAVASLLSNGASPTSADKFQRTPLHYAADRGELGVIEQLLAAEEAVDVADSRGRMPYSVALLRGHAAATQLIAAARPLSWYSMTPLQAAAGAGDVRAVAALLAVQGIASWQFSANNALRPLAMVVERGHLEVVKMLIRAGDELSPSLVYNSPLYLAAVSGHLKVVKVLLGAGAKVEPFHEVEAADIYGFEKNENACGGHLYFAAKHGNVQVVREMLQAGASLLSVKPAAPVGAPAEGQAPGPRPMGTVLHCLVSYCKLDALKTFVAAGADVNLRNIVGATALHNAGSLVCDQQFTEVLIDAGADVNAVDVTGTTALHVAAVQGNAAVVRVLLAAGAAMEVQDSEGYTTLAHALRHKKRRAAAELLVAGADLQTLALKNQWEFEEMGGKVLQQLKKEKQVLIPKVQLLYSVRSNLALLLCAYGCAEGFRAGAQAGAKGLGSGGSISRWCEEVAALAREVKQLRQDFVGFAEITPRMQEALVCVAASYAEQGSAAEGCLCYVK